MSPRSDSTSWCAQTMVPVELVSGREQQYGRLLTADKNLGRHYGERSWMEVHKEPGLKYASGYYDLTYHGSVKEPTRDVVRRRKKAFDITF
jgi:hypothetical protein